MIQIDNILKIVDIQKNQVSKDTFDWLSNYINYLDQVLKEHLINIQDAIDEAEAEGEFSDLQMDTTPNAEVILKEVRELHELCKNNDAAYIRFIEG
jgi:hypothetical protein